MLQLLLPTSASTQTQVFHTRYVPAPLASASGAAEGTPVAPQVSVIEAAMKELHFSVSPKVATKRQALEMIPRLRELIPLQRKHMRMRARVPSAAAKTMLALLPDDAVVESNTEVDIHRASGMPWSSAVASGAASEAAAAGAQARGRTIDFTAEPEQLRRLRTWGEALDAYKLYDIIMGEYMPEDDEALLADAASESSKAPSTKKGKKGKKGKKAAVYEPSPVEAADAADVPPEVRVQWFPVSVDVLAMTVETAAAAAASTTTALGDRDIMSLGTIRVDGGASGDPGMDSIAGAVASSGGRVVSQAAPVQPVVKASSGAALVCRKCAGAEFDTRDEYRAHFRSQWHTLNLKRALMSLPAVDEQRMAGLSEEDVQALLKEATPQ
mgnify:CR=1 FL=1